MQVTWCYIMVSMPACKILEENPGCLLDRPLVIKVICSEAILQLSRQHFLGELANSSQGVIPVLAGSTSPGNLLE